MILSDYPHGIQVKNCTDGTVIELKNGQIWTIEQHKYPRVLCTDESTKIKNWVGSDDWCRAIQFPDEQ